jgi:hypothetical protein
VSTEGFAVVSQLTPTDWYACQAAIVWRAQTRGVRGVALVFGVPLVVGALTFAAVEFGPARGHAGSLGLGMLIGYLALLVVSRVSRRMLRPAEDGAFLGDIQLEFTAAGISVRRPTSRPPRPIRTCG